MVLSRENLISQFQILYYLKISCISILYQKDCLKLGNNVNNLGYSSFQYHTLAKATKGLSKRMCLLHFITYYELKAPDLMKLLANL